MALTLMEGNEAIGWGAISAGCKFFAGHPITVMRGHSVSELILFKEEIGYTGIDKPSTVIALGQEGVNGSKKIIAELTPETLVLKAAGVDLTATVAEIREIDFKAHKVKSQDWALAAIVQLARTNRILSLDMLDAALELRFKGKVLAQVRKVVDRFAIINSSVPTILAGLA